MLATVNNVQNETEQYYQAAEQAKKNLINALHAHNLKGAHTFIADALAYALTSHFYEEQESRQELQENYFGLACILERCLALKEAENTISLLEGSK